MQIMCGRKMQQPVIWQITKKTQKYLKENIPYFWGKDSWPLKSPDLNFLESSILAYSETNKYLNPSSIMKIGYLQRREQHMILHIYLLDK